MSSEIAGCTVWSSSETMECRWTRDRRFCITMLHLWVDTQTLGGSCYSQKLYGPTHFGVYSRPVRYVSFQEKVGVDNYDSSTSSLNVAKGANSLCDFTFGE